MHQTLAKLEKRAFFAYPLFCTSHVSHETKPLIYRDRSQYVGARRYLIGEAGDHDIEPTRFHILCP